MAGRLLLALLRRGTAEGVSGECAKRLAPECLGVGSFAREETSKRGSRDVRIVRGEFLASEANLI